jgi:hypothetical protein
MRCLIESLVEKLSFQREEIKKMSIRINNSSSFLIPLGNEAVLST